MRVVRSPGGPSQCSPAARFGAAERVGPEKPDVRARSLHHRRTTCFGHDPTLPSASTKLAKGRRALLYVRAGFVALLARLGVRPHARERRRTVPNFATSRCEV